MNIIRKNDWYCSALKHCKDKTIFSKFSFTFRNAVNHTYKNVNILINKQPYNPTCNHAYGRTIVLV